MQIFTFHIMASLCVFSDTIILSFTDKMSRIAVGSDVESTDVHYADKPPDDDTRTAAVDGYVPIVCSALSGSASYFAASSAKNLNIWRTDDWSCLRWPLARAASSIAFSHSERYLVVADKSGDAYVFDVSCNSTPGRLLLGHVSMLLKIALSPDDRFVVTCDRDEKIRVSRFPNAYNIETYCLGHADCVTCLDFPRSHPVDLVSGSSDGTVRIWDYRTGRQIGCYDNATDERPIVVDLTTAPADSGYLISAIFDRFELVRLLFVKRSHSCDVSLYRDVSINCSVPRALTACGDRLFVLSYKVPYVSVLQFDGKNLKFCEELNEKLKMFMSKYSEDFAKIIDRDGGQFSYLNKRKIDDTQDYYNRKKERLLEKSGEIKT